MVVEAQTETVQFTIPGKPGHWQRRVQTKSGHSYMPAQVKNGKALVVAMFLKIVGPDFRPYEGPVSLLIAARWRHAKSPQWRRELAEAENWPRPKTPDIDNIVKLILDALNGVAYEDDRQVTWQMTYKCYGKPEGTTVTLIFHAPNPATKAEWKAQNSDA